MNILQEMKDQRDRLNLAIRALNGATSTPQIGRRAGSKLSPASRRKIALAAKKRWAAAKKAGRNRL